MEKKVYAVFKDSHEDLCEMVGYIYGTAAEADAYCEELNKDNQHECQDYHYEELECLNPQQA